MNTFDERMQDAASALAEVITDEKLPPLRLQPRRRLFRAPGRRSRRAMNWLAPLAAAVAVVAIVAASLVIAHDRTPARPSTPSTPAGLLGQVPAYYIDLVSNSQQRYVAADIMATATGKVQTVVNLPPGYAEFTIATIGANVAVASDDRSFVLQAVTRGTTEGDDKIQFFLVRFSPQQRTATIKPLLRRPVGGPPYLIALSPDGTKLAYSTGDYGTTLKISVLTLATGTSRSWVNRPRLVPGQNGEPQLQSLSWSAQGEVQYIENVATAGKSHSHQYHSGLLNPASTSKFLPAGTVLPARLLYGYVTPGNYLITYTQGDLTKPAHRTASWGISEYVLPGAHRVDNLGPVSPHGQASSIFWSNAAGSVLIILNYHQNGSDYRLGIIGDGRYRPLPATPSFTRSGGFPVW